MTTTDATPSLPDGLVVVVKRECETCQTVVPVAGLLAQAVPAWIIAQVQRAPRVAALAAPFMLLPEAGWAAVLRVLPLLRAFTMVEEEFFAHVEAEDKGMFAAILVVAETGLDLEVWR